MTDTRLAAEVVKLKQEMAELRAVVQGLEEVVSISSGWEGNHYYPKLKPIDDGWGHAEDGWPWDASATDGIATGTREPKPFIPK